MTDQQEKSPDLNVSELNAMEAGVSIIVFSYNSSKLIVDTLRSIIELPDSQYPTEIILVDNNSSDNTVKVAEGILENQNLPFQILHQPKPGLFHSRVAGINAAQYKYFIFVDDDNRLKGDWVTTVCELFDQRPQTGLIGGVNTAELETDEPEWWDDQKHAYAVGRANVETGPVYQAFSALWGAGLSGRTAPVRLLYKEAKFWLVGRMEKTLLAGEDSELCYWMRLIGFGVYQSELSLHHFIESRKLSEDYLLGIHKGFRVSDHYLLQYRTVLINSSWFWQNIQYASILKLKWLLKPFRIIGARSNNKKLEITTKSATFKEVLKFWWQLPKWRKIHREICRRTKQIRKLYHLQPE